MKSLRDTGSPIDMITLVEELDRRKEVEAIGGVAYLSSLIDGVPERPSIEYYVRIVLGKAQLRGLINVCQNAIAEAIEHTDEPEQILARTEQGLIQLSAQSVGKKPFVTLSEASWPTYEAMHHAGEATIKTSLPGLDRKTSGGIWQEEVCIIGGDPGSGKSALASQIAAENARIGKRGAIFSIEMKTGRLLRRLCYESGLLYSKLKHSPELLSPGDHAVLKETMDTAAGWPLAVNDASNLNPQAFAALARHAVLRDHADFVVLDHIQHMTQNMPGSDEISRVTKVSAVLRQIAKDYCPVIALSQLSRQNKEQRGQRPTMRDLKGSSSLEQDASVILLTWRPTDEQGEFTKEDEIIVAKNREGEPGIVPVRFEGAVMRYVQREAGL